MIGYVNLNVIVNKIITDHSTSELYEFKDIIKTMLDTYAYELSILSNCNKLISTNNFKLFKKYKTNIQHSFGNKEEQQQEEGNFFCLICNQALDQYAYQTVIICSCNHYYHRNCMPEQSKGQCIVCKFDIHDVTDQKKKF